MIVLAAAALLWLVLATWLPFARLWYPFELEWLGGLVGDHVTRIRDGEPIYVAPSAEFVPLLYTPLYMYLGAGVSLLTGEGLLPLRLLSILAALSMQVMLFLLVRTETRSRLAGLLACGVWSGSYFVVDTWWDAERVDSTFLAFVLAGLLLLRRGRGFATAALAGAIMVLAYLTKQTALPIAVALAVSALLSAPRRGVTFALAFAGLWLVATQAGDAMTGGWFSFYTWALPNDHGYDFTRLGTYFHCDIVQMLPALALIGWCLAHQVSQRAPGTLAMAALWGGLLGAALLSRCHLGSSVNALMPGWLGNAAAMALAWQHFARSGKAWIRHLAASLVLLQLAVFAFDFGIGNAEVAPTLRNVMASLPTQADAAAGHRLVAMLREADGEVLVPFHGYLPHLAGKRGGANAMAVFDVRGERARNLMAPLRQEFLASARQRKAALVVLDGLQGAGDIWQLVIPGYEDAGRLVPEGDEDTFVPRVGLPTRPILLFRRSP